MCKFYPKNRAFICIYEKKAVNLQTNLFLSIQTQFFGTMSSVNKVILIGNVGADPEVRYLDRGVAIATFNLATTERGYTMQNGTQVPDVTEWHSVVLWRNLAEWAQQNLRKSMKVYVEGKLKTRSWEKDGQIKRKTEVIAENIQILYRPEQYRRADGLQVTNESEEAVADTQQAEDQGFNDIF